MLRFEFNPFPIITTERLVLREIAHTDAEAIFAMRSDAAVMQDRVLATSLDDAAVFIGIIKHRITTKEGVTWAITLRGDDTLIGTIGFWRLIPEHMRAEIGYDLLPAHHGKGIMAEAMKALLDHGFNQMNLHSVEANVNPDNLKSIAILERNGFVREGYFKESYFSMGKFWDSAIYSLVKGSSST